MIIDPPRKILLFVKHQGEDPTQIMEASMIQVKKSNVYDSGIKDTQNILDQLKESENKDSKDALFGKKEEKLMVQPLKEKTPVKFEEAPVKPEQSKEE